MAQSLSLPHTNKSRVVTNLNLIRHETILQDANRDPTYFIIPELTQHLQLSAATTPTEPLWVHGAVTTTPGRHPKSVFWKHHLHSLGACGPLCPWSWIKTLSGLPQSTTTEDSVISCTSLLFPLWQQSLLSKDNLQNLERPQNFFRLALMPADLKPFPTLHSYINEMVKTKQHTSFSWLTTWQIQTVNNDPNNC